MRRKLFKKKRKEKKCIRKEKRHLSKRLLLHSLGSHKDLGIVLKTVKTREAFNFKVEHFPRSDVPSAPPLPWYSFPTFMTLR